MGSSKVVTPSTNLQKAVCWVSETVQDHPEKKRDQVIKEAQIRFDLTPVECEFLTDKFSEAAAGKSC